MKNKLSACILAAIAAMALFTGCEKAEAPDQVVKHFFEAQVSGEILAVKPYISPDAVLILEQNESNPNFVKSMPQIIEQQKNLWKDVTLTYSVPEGNKERMKVVVTAKYKDAQYSTTMILLSINGKWLISLCSVSNNSPEWVHFIQSIALAKNLISVAPAPQEQKAKKDVPAEKKADDKPAPATAEAK